MAAEAVIIGKKKWWLGGGMLIIYSAGKEPVGGEYVRVKNKRIVTVLTHFFFYNFLWGCL